MSETVDRTESLFAASVELPTEERELFLERECPGDPDLRDRLLALLKAHDRAGHVIDRPVNGDPDQTAGYAPSSEQAGVIIAGRYKLQRLSFGSRKARPRRSVRPIDSWLTAR